MFQEAKGRFLELRLRLAGNGGTSPHIRAPRASVPRFSYLTHISRGLPQEPVSASFLDRYLSDAEGLFTTLEGRIASAQLLFDSRTSPREYLDWLLGWLGDEFNPDWDDSRRRLLLANAVLLFRWRGTVPGLRAMIRIAIEPCPDQPSSTSSMRPRAVQPLRQSECPDRGAVSPAKGPPRRARNVHAVQRTAVRFRTGAMAARVGAEPFTGAIGVSAIAIRQGVSEADALHALNAAWGSSYTSFTQVGLSPVVPAQPVTASDWREFTRNRLEFEYYPVTAANADAFRTFLRNRYSSPGALSDAYQLTGGQRFTDFATVALPGENEFPSGGQRLFDWIEFVSQVLPLIESAHRFTVLVPFQSGESEETQALRLATVRQVVTRESGHTQFRRAALLGAVPGGDRDTWRGHRARTRKPVHRDGARLRLSGRQLPAPFAPVECKTEIRSWP